MGEKIKEWDSVVTPDEIFSLDDLDEFVSTDFSPIFRNVVHQDKKSEPQLVQKPLSEKRERSANSVLESQSKRRKLEIGVLYGFIPKVRHVALS